MPTSPFPVNETLTGVVLAYENKNLIADRVLPVMPVASKKYDYIVYPKGQLFSVPDTRVGRKSQPNSPDFSGTELTDKVDDRALDDFIPQSDMDEALEGIDPKSKIAEWLTKLMDLDHEIKTANLVFNPATYIPELKQTLSGTSQWSDYENSDPLSDLSAALDEPIMRPNRMVIGQRGWTVLRRHPKVVEAIKGTGAKEGGVTREQLAEELEIDEVIVGTGRQNFAKKGQDIDLRRVWGNHCALIYIDEMADTQNGITFGGSPRYKKRFAGDWWDKNRGVEGGWMVKVGDYMHEKIFASDCGYFFEDIISSS